MSKIIKTGLVSFGKSSRIFHAPVLTSLSDYNLTTVVERNRKESKRDYPNIKVVNSLNALLEDGDIELVVITTPNDTHFELAEKCLAAGKHVVVDKPFTVTSQEARKLTKTAEEKGLVISAFQNRRWDGDFLSVKKIAENHLLGRLVAFESRFNRFRNYKRPGAWRESPGRGTGLFYDIGPHLIDQALVLFGMPKAVTADIRTQRDEVETDDHFHIRLDYTGLKVILEAGMLVRVATPRFLLHGTNGSFLKYGLDPQEEALNQGKRPDEDPDWGKDPESKWGIIETDINNMHVSGKVETERGDYRCFYKNMAASIHGKDKPAVLPVQMIQTIELIEHAFKSSHEKRTVAL